MTTKRQRRLLWVVLIALPVLSVLAALLTLALRDQNAPAALPAPNPTGTHALVDSTAPNFELARQAPEGTVRLSSLRGQVVFINFWAIWCEPCRREFPAFQAYQTEAEQPATILAVNVGDKAEQIAPYLAELGVDAVTVLLDTDFSVSDAYDTDLFPSTYVVDAAGVVRAVHIGEITRDDLEAYATQYAS